MLPLRLVTYTVAGAATPSSVGLLLDEETILDVPMASREAGTALPGDMIDLLQCEGFSAALRPFLDEPRSVPASAVVPRATARLWAPVPVPNSIRDVPLFMAHVQAGQAAIGLTPNAAIGTIPAYYKGNRRSVIGTDDEVVAPSYADVLDFEMEIGLYIGRGGKNIAPEDVPAHIGGYTIFNDASARVRQGEEMAVGLGPAKGKDFDNGNVMGPCLVTDLDLARVQYTVRVNGEEWVAGTLPPLHWPLEDVVSYISTSETLYPGDFIGLGTVPGGCGLELGRYPQHGDLLELEAAPIGVLRCRYSTERDTAIPRRAAAGLEAR